MPETPSPRLTLLALGISIGSFASLQSLLVPVLPTMQADLDTDAAGITWALTVWLIVAAVATPLLGRVGDLYGKRRIFLLALGAVALGSMVAAVAPTLPVLLVARGMQGLGGAIFPLAFGLVRDALPRERVAGGIGTISALMAVGSGLGTVFAGPLAQAITWRGLFLVPLLGVVVGGILVLLHVRDNGERATGRLNFASAALLSGWLVALLLPISSGAAWGWGSPLVIGLFVAAAVLVAAWIAVELRAREPLVDMRMMRLPGVWNTNLAGVLIGAAMFGVWAYFARFLQEPTSTGYGLGADVAAAGLVMLPMLVIMAVVGFFTGAITRVVPLRAQLAGGAAAAAIATAGIAGFHSQIWELTVEAGLLGLGLGVAYAAMTNIIVQSVPATQTGVASGMNSNLRTIGSGIGTAMTTAIVVGSASGPLGQPTEAGYRTGFLVLAILAAAAAVIALVSRARSGSPAFEAVDAPAPIREAELAEAA